MSTRNCEIIAVTNQKGGVGKTTTTVNIATSLAAVGRKVLLIDLDPQGNASSGFGIDMPDRNPNIYNVLAGQVSVQEAEKKTMIPNLTIIPSTMDLSAAEVELATAGGKEYYLRNALEASSLDYDHIIIDTPPSLGMLTVNTLTAAHNVLIPMQCEYYALEGLSHLLSTIERVQNSLNPELDIKGIVFTMYDPRNRLTQQVEEEVRKYLGDRVYKTVIPRNVKLSEAPSHGKPAVIYDYRCSGSKAYLLLAREMLKQMQTAPQKAA